MLDLPLTGTDLSRLSDEEAIELLRAYEAKHLDKCKCEMAEYARYIEVPGTPSPASQDTLDALLEHKRAQRRKVHIKPGENLWEDPENVPFEADVPEEEFYPKQLDPAAHHDLIMNSIQALIEEEPVTGPLANGHVDVVPEGVMLFMPPGSAKSSYGSVVSPSWIMGRWPGIDVIGLSYASELAKRFGRRVRHVCRSRRFQDVFGCTLTGDNQAVDQWSLTNGSTYRAVGILAGVTGNRANICIIDDPIAGREEAESEVIRDKTNEAIKDDVMTRLKPYGKVVIIQTRWHENDPAGHLLGEDWEGQSGLWQGTGADGKKTGRWWLVLCLPFACDREDDPLGREIGEILWKEYFDRKGDGREMELRRSAGERSWMSLQQQKPAASEGVILLKRYWKCWQPMSRLWHGKPDQDPDLALEENQETPRNWTQCVLVYDTAIEEGEDNDYSAMTAWAAFGAKPKLERGRKLGEKAPEEQQNLILLGGWRAKVQAVDLLNYVDEHVKFFKPDHIVVEKRASGHQLLQELRRQRPRYVENTGQIQYVSVHEWVPPFPPRASGKVPRLNSASVLLAQGTVWYMPGATNQAIIKEAASAPNGKYDDWCFVAGTMIALQRGLTPIEEVQVGDMALTPLGWRRVSAAGLTGIAPVISRLGLTGTEGHPVFTLDGYRPLAHIMDNVTVSRMGLCNLIATIRRRPWFMPAARGGVGTRRLIITLPNFGSEAAIASRVCTLEYGKIRTADALRRAKRYIIRTKIHLIVALTIWSAYRRLCIARYLEQVIGRPGSWLIWNGLGLKLRSGIAVRRAVHGTASMQSPLFRAMSRANGYTNLARALGGVAHAKCAALSFLTRMFGRSFVLVNATPAASGESRSVALEIATFAETGLWPATPSTKHAHTHAIGNAGRPLELTPAPVYNLTVEGAHCYYANGVLVHNCDTITCMLIWSRSINLLDVPFDLLEKDEEETMAREQAVFEHDPRPLYGRSRSSPVSNAARSLYGRSPKDKRHWED